MNFRLTDSRWRSIPAATFLLLLLAINFACDRKPQPNSDNETQWQPITSIPGGFRRDLISNSSQPGPFKYQLKIPAGARAGAHHHSQDVHVKVLSGSMFIIIDEPLESSRVQHFATGSVFMVPAHTTHEEWWNEQAMLEAEGVGPMETVYDQAVQNSSAQLISRVDHLVYAATDLNRGVEEIETLIGVRATAGGQHPGRGTRNALIALGPTTYLEILAPDPEQPTPAEPRPFGIDGLKQSKLVAWFVNSRDLEQLRSDAVSKGVPFGEVKAGSRKRPDGSQLSWQFTDPSTLVADGIVPLLINWGESSHPALTAAKGATLVSLRAEHPEIESVRQMLQHVGVDLPVSRGNSPAIIAVIEGLRGRVELR